MKAYVTLLSNDKYYDGVLVLHRTLLELGSQYPLYCLLSESVDDKLENRLKKNNIPCIRLNHKTVNERANSEGQFFSHWNYTFDKLQIWGLTQFDKIVFLDSDMLILRNLDSLFECDSFSAVCAGASYPGHESWNALNSGLMVITPDKSIEANLIKLCQTVVQEFRQKNLSVGDQDVIHRYDPSWGDKPYLHLDEGYNLFAEYLAYYIRHLGYSMDSGISQKPIYVVHFIGKFKPWMKPTLRNKIWLLRTWIRNPYYYKAYRKFRSYLSKK